MFSKTREASNIELLGGHISLDFTNTVSTRLESHQVEHLRDYSALVDWSRHAGILSLDRARRLKRLAAHHPSKAATVHHRAIELREVLFRIFSAVAQGNGPRDDDLHDLNTALRDAMGRLQVHRLKERFQWGWASEPEALDAMLWPVVRAGAELLTAPERQKIRQCANHPLCQWLFLDKSKNHSRRWCSMALCGSRDKVKRYYHRKKLER